MKRSSLVRRTPLRKISKKRESLEAELRVMVKGLLIRSNGICEICKVNKGQEPHHIKPRSKGTDHSLENLLLVCRPCHIQIHNNPLDARQSGLLK